ncbi:MAG: hypothetical protein JNM17_08155 [Archangium sp.]|nr:hypothetical protein [Archangium sp.]
MRRLALVLVLSSCALTKKAPSLSSEPTAQDLACQQALTDGSARFDEASLTACTHDFDCREVSPLIAGKCGAFVNGDAFGARRTEFARGSVCDGVVLVVPRCTRLRPVCVAGRCGGEPVAQIVEECEERNAALNRARTAANVCVEDTDCAVMSQKAATSKKFFDSAAKEREQLARACGAMPPQLFVALDEPTTAFCVAGVCQTDRQFTTTVRAKRGYEYEDTWAESKRGCVFEALEDSVSESLGMRDLELSFKVTLSEAGEMNEFEFVQQIPPSIAYAFAARLHACEGPRVTRRGKPVSVRWTITMIRN